MILIDTNVISELMKVAPSQKLLMWMGQHTAMELFITTITIAEISYGLNALPNGKRRHSLEEAFNQTIREAFCHRVVEFNEKAAIEYGVIMAKRKRLGRPLSVLDGQIAGIARAHGFALATRNTRDFIDSGVNVLNPFL